MFMRVRRPKLHSKGPCSGGSTSRTIVVSAQDNVKADGDSRSNTSGAYKHRCRRALVKDIMDRADQDSGLGPEMDEIPGRSSSDRRILFDAVFLPNLHDCRDSHSDFAKP